MIFNIKGIAVTLFGIIIILSCKTAVQKLQQDEKIKPNILIIYTDQQRYNTINSLGNSEVQTPNFDQLVKQGTAFTNSFVSAPVCMPSRSSLFSGMYTTSHETYSNHHPGKKRPETTLPIELKKLGYKTALMGKNHTFMKKGIDMDIMDSGVKVPYKPTDKRSDIQAAPWSVEKDPMHQLTDKALRVIKDTKEEGKPLFMWLSYLYPHTPFYCPEPYYSMYNDVEISEPVVEKNGLKAAGKPFRQQFHQRNNNLLLPYDKETTMRMKRTYYGMISLIDDEIGRIIKFLEENNMRENTLIVFTSDHGDYMGDHGLYTKSPAMYDQLVRVPLIFSLPNIIKGNIISDEMVFNVDLMPTILDFVNAPIPAQVQGHSLEQGLRKGSFKNPKEYAFSEYGIPGKPITEEEVDQKLPDLDQKPIDYGKDVPWEANPVALSGRFRMIRSKTFKLVEEINGTNELYDLRNDPNELVNIYGNAKYAKVQAKLLEDLHQWKQTLPGIEKDNDSIGQENFEKYLKKRNKVKK